jgi:arylsulfatase A
MISDLDRHVGAVRAALEKAGILDETLIVFTSDNGATHPGMGKSHFHIGGADPVFFNSEDGLRGYKGSLYEGGIRVPLMVRLPGKVKAGAVNDTPSFFADWFPTLCGAADLKIPENLDGTNIWPAISEGKDIERKTPMLWFYPEYGGQVAARIGDFKIIRCDLMRKNPGPWEVFDLKQDRGESRNIAAEKPGLIRQTLELLKKEVVPNAIFPMIVPDI